MKLRWICSTTVVLLGFVGPMAPARAESINLCIDRCVDTYGTDQWELQQMCVNECRNRVNYGAIAYAEDNGAYGFSYAYHSAAEANQRALSNCRANGAGCKVVISFSETCAALAAGDNDRFAASLGDGCGAARGDALTACSRNGGKHCEIKTCTCARD